MKGPLHAIRNRGWQLSGLSTDTALAAYLADPPATYVLLG